MELMVIAVCVTVASLALLSFSGKHSPVADAESHYIAGDGEALLAGLAEEPVDTFVPHATALGLYREALEPVEKEAPEYLRPGDFDEHGQLLQVNLAEPLMELGRFDEALALLERPVDSPLAEAGRRCARAWLLTLQGRTEEALRDLDGVEESALGFYRAELWMTEAHVHLIAGRLAEAETGLKRARRVASRASSERNLEFLYARLRWAQGRREEALESFELAAHHRWRWQGGAGLLAWGDALAELGRHEEARAAWTQCVQQDPQSLAAADAAKRLS